MLFEEYSLTPQLFEKETLEKEPGIETLLSTLLRDMKTNGLLADLNAAKWHESVASRIEGLPHRSKERLEKLLEYLQGRNRIVRHEAVVKEDMGSEKDWLETALEEDRVKPYYAILHSPALATKEKRVMSLTEFQESELWARRKTSYVFMQTETNLRKYLRDFLSYARTLEMMDPYFDPTSDRYRKMLEVVVNLFGKRRGKPWKGVSIEIHTRFDSRKHGESFQRSATKILKELSRKHDRPISMKFWDDPYKMWHDRYMVTEQGAVSSSTGLDVRHKGESIWTIIDYSDIGRIVSNFRENSSRMSLRYTLR